MSILGIETSCDETAAAVVTDKLDIRANVVSSQIDLHRVTHGVVPEVAARAHTEKILPVIDECLRMAKLGPADLDAIAVTRGPGLITSLLVGLETAKSLSYAWGVPVIGINHIEGHVLSNLVEQKGLRGSQKLSIQKKLLPLVVLTVSGGHTELLLLRKAGQLELLGRTRDDAAGEAFDKGAKMLGLPYPGGPAISEAAAKGRADYVEFPRPMLEMDNYDFSFAGLKTALVRELEGHSKKDIAKNLSNIAASFEMAIVDTLTGKAERAIKEFKAKELWIVGGVAANKLLRRKAQSLAKKDKISLRIPSFEFCTDNAVMIAAVGAIKASQKKFDKVATLAVDPNLELQYK